MSRMPQVTARELIRFLKSEGFAEDRQSGSHLTLWHQERKVSVTVPVHTACGYRTELGRADLKGRRIQCGGLPPPALIE